MPPLLLSPSLTANAQSVTFGSIFKYLNSLGSKLKFSFYQFKAHSAVVIWAFPKTSLIINMVCCSIVEYSPIPLSMFFVNEISLYIIPTFFSIDKSLFILKMLINPSKKSSSRMSLLGVTVLSAAGLSL